ncbi:MAG: asparagine synthase (glutamine-hydrolyzing) [Cyclobacteriaceae bacterium]|nr:asparagine synthase (glutamine-hydrolyzing) [Cyclobacteriaceae bacterium]
MCGICGIAGENWQKHQLMTMIEVQSHRGPDACGHAIEHRHQVGLGHNRLSIIDLSEGGAQPMSDHQGKLRIVYNGEIYNYLELKKELSNYPFRSQSDTEVILAAYQRWGLDCVDHFIGMFAFAIWDDHQKRLFLARDRFGVKPLYMAHHHENLYWSSEIKTLLAAGVPAAPNLTTWASYLRFGLYEHTEQSFWEGIKSIPPGGAMTWENGREKYWRWYDLSKLSAESISSQSEEAVMDRYRELLENSVRFRFRSDVPVAINLSGGLDSSILLGMVDHIFGAESDIRVFTFATGDPNYDETPWVRQMLQHTGHPHEICTLTPDEIPQLALDIQSHQDEPFGGFPTLAYSKIFKKARSMGIKVLLDGQGLDEQWAGYDYYGRLSKPLTKGVLGPVQGSADSPVRPDCLIPEFLDKAMVFEPPTVFQDPLLNAQYKDARFTKIPRALRFNDRISMMYSTELREPFLDHRLFELAFMQPSDRKIRDGVHKWLLREIGSKLLPRGVVEAPKRPVQTPQREWLRGPLAGWVDNCLLTLDKEIGGDWLNMDQVRGHWNRYQQGESDNSFYIWQWINLALWFKVLEQKPMAHQSHS